MTEKPTHINVADLAAYLSTQSDEEWAASRDIWAEEHRMRQAQISAPVIIQEQADLLRQVHARRGHGAEYRQPQGAHDAYMRGQVISEGGKLFRAVQDFVVWPPSTLPEAWEEVPADEAEDATTPPAVQSRPWGLGEWKVGDIAEWNGRLWRVHQALTVYDLGHTPNLVPAHYTDIGPAS